MEVLTRAEIRAASDVLAGIIGEVCGACALNCCHQGTMVGSDDARRIARAARLSPEFRARVIEGLAERARELRQDLGGLESAQKLLRLRFSEEKPADLARLETALEAWRRFCDFLERDFRAEPEDVQRCLLFSALRATALRALRAFPGGENVLPALAGRTTSFQAGRRGVKADRCLFHLCGCLVPTAKPHKCADFYCGSDPGLINEIVDRMTFDQFTLAHLEPWRREDLLATVAAELELGREFFEPKVILGGDERLASEIAALLARSFSPVTQKSLGGGHFDATVDLPELARLQPEEAYVVHCGSVDAIGIYELAVHLVRARGRSARPAVVVVAEEFHHRAGAIHPLWRTRAMSQPLSALNLWVVIEE